eukprot:TRINITY_DN8527_c0_g1_i2.p1 TRINITY_DN8527_c0_g1~~TRINITY_DN8527_c0_g1_i2.p1  ORF type:complete len:333 (+),score=32.12 TRINITY_DN8527_c0_g1_i2:298-1296(+)
MLGNTLNPNEVQFLTWQAMCLCCFSQGSPSLRLDPCPGCSIISFCPKNQCPNGESQRAEAIKLHQPRCNHFRFLVECEEYLNRGCYLSHTPISDPDALRTSSSDDWDSYWDREHSQLQLDQVSIAFARDLLSDALTIAFAMRSLIRAPKTEMRICLIGAEDSQEGSQIEKYEEILHAFPSISRLDIVMIGPTAGDGIDHVLMCDSCQTMKRTISVAKYSMLFDQWAIRSDAIMPDMFVLLNSGIHEMHTPNIIDSWSHTLNLVSESKIPWMATAYTQDESSLDAARFRSVGMECQTMENPFRGGYPKRDPDHRDAVFFQNYQLILQASHSTL